MKSKPYVQGPAASDNKKVEQKKHPQQDDLTVSKNPNPAANENIKDKPTTDNKNKSGHQVGSEITDGEDG